MSLRSCILILAAAAMAGCGPKFYTEQADRQVYTIIAQKNVQALGRAPEFTIKAKDGLPQGIRTQAEVDAAAKARGEDAPVAPVAAPPPAAPAAPAAPDAPGAPDAPQPATEETGIPENLPPPVPEPGPDAIHLSVSDTLRVAVRSSRDYQTAKETVYQRALALTFQRYLFQPQPFATGSVNFNSTSAGERTRSWDSASGIGVSQQLADGAILTGSLALTALKFLNRELGDVLDSTLDFTLSQPLWRGAGRKIVQENLLQSERNALYAVRTFAKFEQDFSVSIASQYLRVLQQRDRVMNAWMNYLSLKRGREQSEWLAKADRLPEFQVDQARQDELRAYNSWVVEREDFANAVDDFKIVLGIPVTTNVALAFSELEELGRLGLQHPRVVLDEITAKAIETRLDLANVRDGVDDAGRKVMVAEDGLKGDVDLVASVGYASRGEKPQSARLAFRRGDYTIGFDIDLPVDRLSERNALRETQISLHAAQRTLEESEDNVILDVRRSSRRLEQALETYEIQKRSVALAEQRVESTQLLLQAGRASQRDVLEAEQALLDTRNALTGALVTHTIARLELERDIGTLVVDEEGQIHGWHLTDNAR
jgi:outer membrane protein TolC